MSVYVEKRYFTVCDECQPPESAQRGPEEYNESDAITAAKEDGWAAEAGRHICDSCLRRREENACAARPQGHRWKTDWDPRMGTHTGDGWCRIDQNHAWRRCLDCPRHEYDNTEERAL